MPKRMNRTHLITHLLPQSPVSEAYRLLRTNIDFASFNQKRKVLLVTSTGKGEGKTSTSANIATVYAQTHRRVLVIDADMRNPQCQYVFSTSNLSGLSNYLAQESALEACIVETRLPNIHLLPAGAIPPNPAELLTSEYLQQLISAVRVLYDMVSIDTPPVLPVADAVIISQQVDGVLFVVDSQTTNRFLAERAMNIVRKSQTPILGVILNRLPKRDGRYAYDSYYPEPATSRTKSGNEV